MTAATDDGSSRRLTFPAAGTATGDGSDAAVRGYVRAAIGRDGGLVSRAGLR